MDTQRIQLDNTQDKTDVRARYDALAQRYIRNYIHPTSLFGFEKQRRLQIVLRYLDDLQPNSVLDLGCGPGYTTSQVAENLSCKSVVGVDFSAEMLSFAHQNYAQWANFLQGDAENLPFQNEQFSAVFALGVLGKYKNPQKILLESFRVLRPNGYLLFTYPNVSSLILSIQRWITFFYSSDLTVEYQQIPSIAKMQNLLHQVGFKIMNRTFLTYGNSFILFPWSKMINMAFEKCFGQNLIGRSISITTFWGLQKPISTE